MTDLLIFQCNVCSAFNRCEKDDLGRENSSCAYCGSAVRIRSIVHHVSMALFGMSLPIARFPRRPDLRGVGLSDWVGYADRFAAKLDYTNTYYHAEPMLDIANVPDDMAGTCDFIVSTDVFEHVLPPVNLAFEGAKKLLKPGGTLVLSVPFMTEETDTREHFPDLFDFEIKENKDGVMQLTNKRRDGGLEVFDDLCFHGGPGTTLEMRLFARDSLQLELEAAGFSNIRFDATFVPEFGIFWKHPWSIPVIAEA